ncbi:MAG TPA: hypothetical protein VM779_13600 [Thermoanaerobaculia bacterium]|nr:hypothetical protein [Thermoanaerobaculia bacterium]
MKSTLRLTGICALALLISAPAAFAQTPESSILPVTEPLDVGGTILQPGQYLIRVLPSNTDRNKVQVTSMDGTTVFATALTVPHALKPNEEVPNTTFIFYPATSEYPRALRTWFAANPEASLGGHDFVYEEGRARALAQVADTRVVTFRETETSVVDLTDETELFVMTPDATIETYTYIPPPPPVRIVTPAPMTSALQMPATASRTPLLALLGLLSLAGAVAIRFTR